MQTAIVGLIGVLIGIFLTEYFRRRSRIEIYSKEVFQKRLDVYEQLYKKVDTSYLIATDIIENPDYSQEERNQIISGVVIDIATFVDQNGLYLNEYLVGHCMLTFIGLEDIYSISDPTDKELQIKEFREAYKKARLLIKKETGMEALDKHFGSISKAKLESEYISLFKEVERARKNHPLLKKSGPTPAPADGRPAPPEDTLRDN